MVRFLVAALLLSTAVVRADDVLVERFRQFFRSELAGRFETEELSEQRVVMLRGLEKHDVPQAAQWLILDVIAREDAADVQREAVRILGKYKRDETVAAMASIWEKKLRRDGEARALVLLAFGSIQGDVAGGVLAKGLQDKDPRVVCCACRAAGGSNRFGLKPALVKLMKSHKHRAVRGAAALALGELGGDEAMPDVFLAFCRDKSERVRYDAWLALKKLALEPKLPCDPDRWREFWERMMMTIPEGEPNPWGKSFPRLAPDYGTPGNFFRIPVMGDRVAFVLDVSLDMDNPWKIDHKTERKKKKEERIPDLFSVKTRWDLACAYVKQALSQMSEATGICFVFFNHEVHVLPEKPKFLKNKARALDKLMEQVKATRRGGSTAMYEGLKAAWRFLREGDPKTNLDKGVDTIVFLTDGQPRDGELANRPERLRDEVWKIAVTRNLRVHCVGLHYHAYELLKQMARDSGGLYVHAQQAGDTTEPQDLDFWPEKKKAFEEARKKNRTPGPRPG